MMFVLEHPREKDRRHAHGARAVAQKDRDFGDEYHGTARSLMSSRFHLNYLFTPLHITEG